jgi:hypothetical protein
MTKILLDSTCDKSRPAKLSIIEVGLFRYPNIRRFTLISFVILLRDYASMQRTASWRLRKMDLVTSATIRITASTLKSSRSISSFQMPERDSVLFEHLGLLN